jgi:glycosyltransferase involved in cell wall biosynthesis
MVTRLSIAVPTYNRAEKLNKQLQCLLSQIRSLENPDFVELIVLDNCSTDSTQDTVLDLKHQNPLKYTKHHKNLGLVGNYLEALKASTGEYIWVVGDDDPLAKDAVSVVLENISGRQEGMFLLEHDKLNGHTLQTSRDSEELRESQYDLDSKDLLDYFAANHFGAFMWITGCVVKNDTALGISRKLTDTVNLAIPFQVSLECALKDGWGRIAPSIATMRTHDNSWAKLYPRLYGLDLPIVLKSLRRAGFDLLVLEQFSSIYKERWWNLARDLKRRKLKSLRDYFVLNNFIRG